MRAPEAKAAERPFTLIDGGTPIEVRATVADGAVRLAPEAVLALGWELKAQGLCRDSICIPLPPSFSRGASEGIDLAELASLLGRPLALDVDEGAAYLGYPAQARAEALASLEAPDFSLPDLAGREHSLRQQRGKKVLLVAWASW
ncbi:MAG: hypothetical protein NVSMB23_28470 [Myxococcales bacterium]